ncbi:AAA family ATPase [uncultured Draconibacterium sp.]|uniref:AAA family ATPase n=1 Tax=uncultured Draconibacterium sp. TaxID=1573823 RepID=UPI003217B0B4
MNKLQIKDFKAFKDELVLGFSNKNFLLYGENGAGKSSIYEAIKVAFFRDKIVSTIPNAPTPEDQDQVNGDFWNKYNNKATNANFEIKLNEVKLPDFPTAEYQPFMMSLEDIFFEDKIRLVTLLEQFYFSISDIDSFSNEKYLDIQQDVNAALLSFKENIEIEIDNEDDFTIKIIDSNRNLESKADIKKYFNEGKLNLVILLLLFTSIKIAQNSSKKRILVLDDFITSLDASNRTFLIKYIFDNFSEFQILIFTHNVSFYNLIMYLINHIYKINAKWEFANLYEIDNNSKLYIKSSIERAANIKALYHSIGTPANTLSVEDIGNKIRQKFEVLLYEFSKLTMIGTVEDSKKILERIEISKNIYYKENKTASDLIDELDTVLDENNLNNLPNRLKTKIEQYKKADFGNLKKIISELKLYQKVTMHPMSHGTIGQSPFTTNEIEKSLELLEKFEKYLKVLVDGDVAMV